jgi:hypothetical protein
MTSDAEIRTWAKGAGVDVPTRGKLPQAVRDQWEARGPEGDNPGLLGDEPAPEHGYADAEPVPVRPQTPVRSGHPDEVAPTPAPSRFGGLKRRSGPARVKREHRRVSLEDVAAGAWGLLGHAAQSYGLVPTGRALVMQAPVAGMILEDTLKGTIVDRIAQPLARGGESAKELSALFGVPALVTLVTVRPEAAEMALPILKRLMRDWAILAGPKIKAREKREKKALEALGVDDRGLDEMVDGWIAAMFHPGEIPEDGDEVADGA